MDRFRDREEMEFLRTGQICSVIANCNRDPKTKPEPFTASDFMPPSMVHKEPYREPTREEMLAAMRELNAQFGGTELNRG